MSTPRPPTPHEVELEVHDDVVFYEALSGWWKGHTGAVFRGGAVDGIGYDALAALGTGRHVLDLATQRRSGDSWPDDPDDLAFLKFRYMRFVEREFDRRDIAALVLAFSPGNVARLEPLLTPWMREQLSAYARGLDGERAAGAADGDELFGTAPVTVAVPAANLQAIRAWSQAGADRPRD